MRILRPIIPLLACGLVIFLPSAAALTITATPPEGPLPYDGSTTIDVRVDASCQEIIADQTPQLTLTAASTVDWIEATGSTIPWTTDQCEPNTASGATTCTPQPDCADDYPRASTSGTVTLTPTNIAPALEPAEIAITIANKEGSATVIVTVAHYLSLNATTDRATIPAALGDKQPFNITLDVNSNVVGTAQFSLVSPPSKGAIKGLDNVAVTPNIAVLYEHHAGFFVWSDGGPDAGNPVSVKVPLHYESPAAVWTADTATVEVRLVSDKDPSIMSDPITLSWNFEPTVTEAPEAESPAPDLIVFVVVLGAALLAQRVRRAQG